jgi:hypothetical protein
MDEIKPNNLVSLLRDFAQGASNSVAGNVAVPVDAIAWLLRKGGVNVPPNPVMGSDWMAEKGLTREPQNKLAGFVGDMAGMVAPFAAAAKAPQIAKGLLSAGEAMPTASRSMPAMSKTSPMNDRGAIDPALFGLNINKDGTVSLYHGTTKKGAEGITSTNSLKSAGEPSVYLTTAKDAGYGDTLMKVDVDPKKLMLDDEFPSGRYDFSAPLRNGQFQVKNPMIVNGNERLLKILERNGESVAPKFPQAEALDLAQQRAALPISENGLGLPANNTAMDRANAMGFDIPAYHGTADDFKKFDVGMAGTKMKKDWGDAVYATPDPSNASYYAKESGAKNAKDLAFKKYEQIEKANGQNSDLTFQALKDYRNAAREAESNATGSNIVPLLLNSKKIEPYQASYGMTDPYLFENLRLDKNGKEIAQIMDNPNSVSEYAIYNPDSLRSKFAAFDPWRRNAAIAASMGVAAPDLLAKDNNELASILKSRK